MHRAHLCSGMSNTEINAAKSPQNTLQEVMYRAQQDCLRRQKVFNEKRKDLKFLTRAQFDAKWGA